MTPKARKLLAWVGKIGADTGQLDILVEDIKCQQAIHISNKGLVAQVEYLLKMRDEVRVREMIWHEVKMLRQYNMERQSKLVPENNRRQHARRSGVR